MNRLATRIALAGVLIASVAIALVASGVLLVGRSTFEGLMAQHGTAAAISYQMFDESVTRVLIAGSVAALACAITLAVLVARQIERPVSEVARAARRIAAGSYDARVARPSSRELASLADSFNQMASSLSDQERQRRDLIENFAHELRTPLTNLHGYLQALMDGVMVASSETYGSLQEEIERLLRLSKSLDLLVAGSAESSQTVELDLAPIVHAIVELHRHSFERRGLTVKVALPSSVWVRADPDALAQVLGNLLQNAGRYAPDGSTVSVRAAAAESDTVVVSVANSGEAIPAGELSHLFERFYRVDKSRTTARGGAGIGLAVVKDLVESAGGKVGVESRPGVTRFWFSLNAAVK